MSVRQVMAGAVALGIVLGFIFLVRYTVKAMRAGRSTVPPIQTMRPGFYSQGFMFRGQLVVCQWYTDGNDIPTLTCR